MKLTLLDQLAQFARVLQGTLFPILQEQLGPLTDKHQQVVAVLNTIRLEPFITSSPDGVGRPLKDRRAIARAFGHDIIIPYAKAMKALRASAGAPMVISSWCCSISRRTANWWWAMRNARKRVLGGLHESEITPKRVFHMLRRLLRRPNQTLGPLRESLKILVMDRGYWGTDPRLRVRRRPARP